jgi:catechol 2,3-dioxygenase-like lactoylglutathione lyase family enzyme
VAAASPSRPRTVPAPRRPALTRPARVTGLGGIFFRARDVDALADWYRAHLGIPVEPGGWSVFQWREHRDADRLGSTVWSLFNKDTTYFGPGEPAFMINYRVLDLDALLEKLRAEGVEIADERHQDENGRFAWITDPEGHRIELWEPAPGH